MASATADGGGADDAELRKNLLSLEDFFNNGMVGLHLVAGDGTILRANQAELEMLGYAAEEYVGRSITEFHADPETIADILARLTRGERLDQYPAKLKRKDGAIRHVLISSSALFRDGAFVNTRCFTVDVTDRVAAEEALRESQEALRANAAYLRNLLDSTEEAFYVVDPDGITTLCNRAFVEMLGFGSAEAAIGRRLHDLIHHSHADGRPYPHAECPVYRVARGGTATHVDGEVFFRVDGSSFPVEYWARPLVQAGTPQGAICTFVDISERKAAEAELRAKESALREETRALNILNRAASLVAEDLDVGRRVQAITDAGVELTGAHFGAFFYNVLNDEGESYMLYTLSGVPREAFEAFPMPRNTAIFGPTFKGEGVVRSDDILADPRYGHSPPYHGMPKGHLPVRSYLAVPVRSRDGDVLGGLFFGHPEAGRFDARAEALMTGLAGQAAVAIDNSRLYQAAEREIAQRAQAEQQLQDLNASLEQRVATEVAERARAEDALRQAQKMEAVGQLTGGVAHDFNNLLTVIIGGLDTIKRSAPGDQIRIQRAADMALQSAQRATSLTSRLLAFSRRQPLQPKPADLNATMRNMTELLHRTLGESIELEGVLAARLWTVEVDPNQLESAILNLALNARDAMPQGGQLTIETANAVLDEGYTATDTEVTPGQYVMVSVSDTGAGMDEATRSRVFEPFFTTKEVGKGTGLGLSMIYGFVKQSGGHVTIYSEPGEGTSVKLYFPRFFGAADPAAEPEAALAPLGHGEEVVLVVEDNEDVRSYSVASLRELGYSVLEAEHPQTALRILGRAERIDLLFTDVVLPGMTGRELADRARRLRPDLRVLFTTGYSRNAIVHQGRLDPGVQLLNKPFTYEQLAGRVRDVLDEPPPGGVQG